MRILFVDFKLPYLLKNSEYPAGGWAVQLKTLLIALSQAGHSVGVLTWKGANSYVGPQNVCELIETYDKKSGIPKLRFITHFVPSMMRGASAFRPDVIVQSCSATETGIMSFIARRLGVPYVHRLASDTDSDGRYTIHLKPYERIAFRYGLRRTTGVICQNAYQEAEMRRSFPRKPTVLLSNAIALPERAVASRSRAGRDYIAWVGVFRHQKNLGLLRRIAARLPDIAFRVAGMPSATADAETFVELEALKRMSNVKLVGFLTHDAIFAFMGQAVGLLCTSHFEGFPNIFLEAFAAGTPVVTPRAVDPSAIVERHALGAAATGEDELVAAMRTLWDKDAGAFAVLSRQCRDYVEAHHDSNTAAVRLVDGLRTLIGARGDLG